MAAVAEDKAQTDAQQDGFNGSVHSVSMAHQETFFTLDPSVAWVIQHAPSEDVEYDSRGYRTKVGKTDAATGVFLGQLSQFVRDGNGVVIERTTIQLPSQDLIEHDIYGPFGLVESTNFSSGKAVLLRTISYDQQGNIQEDSDMDGEQKPISRTVYRRNHNGAWTERTLWIRGLLHSHETYDPDADFQRYEEYDSSGDVMTTFTHHNARVESYWSASNDPNGGTSVIDELDNGDTKSSSCHNETRTCDGRIRHANYLDAARHNPSMTEIVSDDGKLLGRAYYEYQLDAHETGSAVESGCSPESKASARSMRATRGATPNILARLGFGASTANMERTLRQAKIWHLDLAPGKRTP